MKLVYYKLNNVYLDVYWPQIEIGSINYFDSALDEYSHIFDINYFFPVVLNHKGDIVFGYECEDKLNITKADDALKTALNTKKIDGKIVVYIDKKISLDSI